MAILYKGLFGDGRGDLERPLRCPKRVPITYYRSKCFIPVGGELARTPSLTFVVPRNMTETYGGRAVAAAWGEGMARHATLMGKGRADVAVFTVEGVARIFPRRFCCLLGKSKRRCLYKPRVDGGEGSLLILLLPEPLDLTPLDRSVPFCLLTDQVRMASTPSFLVSSFSSSLSAHVPPPREERHRSNDSSGNQSVLESSSSDVMIGAEAKVLQALEVMKSLHDFDSTICLKSLGLVQKRFSILNEYVLHAPRSGQRSYHPCPRGFGISIDALEAGLRFPLHPVIGECLSWWQVSPGQIAPNYWRYIITFLGECKGSGIIPSRDLFLSCFRLCRGQGGYYLTARSGFRVGGAPSNNKVWKSRFLFISRCQGWDFGIEWSAHPISNVLLNLSDEEANVVERLKGILSASRAVRNLTEEWLVEAGLSPASRGTPCLFLNFAI
ncbi:hypothetical protein BHE74_00058633 [Ensete ventricosum]|nr:hypothetical protein BHE74_00058633 [Ensete ventricosum]